MRKITTVERALNSIGKKCFIDFYKDFETCTNKDALSQKLLMNNPNAKSLQAQITRINYAQWIFANKKEAEALNIIIKSNRLDKETRRQASEYLSSL